MWWKLLRIIYTHESFAFYKKTMADEIGETKENINKYFRPLENARLIKIETRPLPTGGRADYIGWTGTGEQLYTVLTTNLDEQEIHFLFDQVLGPLLAGIQQRVASIQRTIENIFVEKGEIPSSEEIAQALEISPRNGKKMRDIDISIAKFTHTISRIQSLIQAASTGADSNIHTEKGRAQIQEWVMERQKEEMYRPEEIINILIAERKKERTY